MTALDPAILRRDLLGWYDRHARALPWRARPGDTGPQDPYRVLLSEVLLQQTQVARGLVYYERFLSAFPDVQALAAADLEAVLKAWEGAGYYARARHLHQAARAIVAAGMPDTLEGLLALPGVGRYTAGAVASIAFSRPEPVVDGNVRRVLARLYGEREPTEPWLWVQARALLERGRPGDWNQALMELGATVCLPRGPRCGECPVSGQCRAFAEGRQASIPAPKARAAVRTVRAVALVAGSGRRYRLEQRPPGGLLGGLHGFPLEEVGAGGRDSALSSLLERRGMAATGRWAGAVEHTMTHRRLEVEVYALSLAGPRLEDPETVALSRLDRKILALLEPGPLFPLG